MRAVIITALMFLGETGRAVSGPPYPRSAVFNGIEFHRADLARKAPGSDIWSCTWAEDGNLYAAWGDGGGFGGTDGKGRVSIGVAKIVGDPPAWTGINVWGGDGPLSKQKPTVGKGTLIAAIGGFTRVNSLGALGKPWPTATISRNGPIPRSRKIAPPICTRSRPNGSVPTAKPSGAFSIAATTSTSSVAR